MTTTERRGRRRLSDDERVLWKEVTRSIAPLRAAMADTPEPLASSAKEAATQDKPKAAAPKSPRVGHAVSTPPIPVQKPSPKPLAPLAPLGRRLKQSLGRGGESIDGRLDLHGLTQMQANAALSRFLFDAQARGAKTVLVITGKGRGDEGGERGVLARQVPQWLRLPDMRACVIGFEIAHRTHGGEGALYIRVRRARSTR